MFDIIGIDWGLSKIGISVGNTENGLILPVDILLSPNNFFEKFPFYLLKYPLIKTVVIGYPLNTKLEKTATTIGVDQFVLDFKKHFPFQAVKTVLERGTTKSAQNTIKLMEKSTGKNLKNKKLSDDQFAAMEILKIYLKI